MDNLTFVALLLKFIVLLILAYAFIAVVGKLAAEALTKLCDKIWPTS